MRGLSAAISKVRETPHPTRFAAHLLPRGEKEELAPVNAERRQSRGQGYEEQASRQGQGVDEMTRMVVPGRN